MAALTGPRWAASKTIKSLNMVLAGSATAYQGGSAAINPASACVQPAAGSTAGLIPIGQFESTVNNSASTATAYVWVTLNREIECFWLDNVTGSNAVTTSNLYQNCYIADDHTATMATGTNAIYGRVWDVDSMKGVLVQFNQF